MSISSSSLSAIAKRMQLTPLNKLSAQAGIHHVYRITIYYQNKRAHNSVATVLHAYKTQYTCETCYENVLNNHPISHEIHPKAYERFTQGLYSIQFDKLTDQANLPLHYKTLWMIERAAGSFYKSILFTPDRLEKPYTTIINILDSYIPESIREVPYYL